MYSKWDREMKSGELIAIGVIGLLILILFSSALMMVGERIGTSRATENCQTYFADKPLKEVIAMCEEIVKGKKT
jgi:hypothetical protein